MAKITDIQCMQSCLNDATNLNFPYFSEGNSLNHYGWAVVTLAVALFNHRSRYIIDNPVSRMEQKECDPNALSR